MTTLKYKWGGTKRIAEVYDDDGRLVAAIYPTRNGLNAIHIMSENFAEEPVCDSAQETGLPGLLIKFKQK